MSQETPKTILITGAGSGLGAAIARRMANAGARLVLADIGDKARKTAEAIDPAGTRTMALGFSVTDEVAAKSAIAATVERFGSLDVLVNNAAIDVTQSLEEISTEDWSRVLDTNLRGPFLMSKLALGALKKADGGQGGQIINIASTASLRAWPNASAYHASKWGLLGLSKALHAELRACGIRVCSVIAGGMKTPFLLERFPDIDATKLQDPANVAEAVHFMTTLPRESVVAEIMVLPVQETSWP